jgi:hypothetical protein
MTKILSVPGRHSQYIFNVPTRKKRVTRARSKIRPARDPLEPRQFRVNSDISQNRTDSRQFWEK